MLHLGDHTWSHIPDPQMPQVAMSALVKAQRDAREAVTHNAGTTTATLGVI